MLQQISRLQFPSIDAQYWYEFPKQKTILRNAISTSFVFEFSRNLSIRVVGIRKIKNFETISIRCRVRRSEMEGATRFFSPPPSTLSARPDPRRGRERRWERGRRSQGRRGGRRQRREGGWSSPVLAGVLLVWTTGQRLTTRPVCSNRAFHIKS